MIMTARGGPSLDAAGACAAYAPMRTEPPALARKVRSARWASASTRSSRGISSSMSAAEPALTVRRAPTSGEMVARTSSSTSAVRTRATRPAPRCRSLRVMELAAPTHEVSACSARPTSAATSAGTDARAAWNVARTAPASAATPAMS